jgi:predicted amidohydrolase
VPSAFTKATGILHWKVLLLVRAIENGAYVLAPATCGSHAGGHQTYGNTMIIDPNGHVLAEAGDEPDVICATIDIAAVATARARIPSLSHDRPFQVEEAAIPEEHHEPV